MKKTMFSGADVLIFENAKKLRNNPTYAERLLWGYLRQRPLGYKFRRQHPMGIYILDFYCHALKLAIEVDGNIHTEIEVRQNDAKRQEELEGDGIRFLRFTNDQVEKYLEKVITTIEITIQ